MGLFDIFRRKRAVVVETTETEREQIDHPFDAQPVSSVDIQMDCSATSTRPSIEDRIKSLSRGRGDSVDYLGAAARVGSSAEVAVKGGDYDEAWRQYHKQKELYVKHGTRSEFTPTQILALDGSVHESLANIRRLEGKHDDALVHFIYTLSTSPRRTKAQEKKLPAYVNRAKLAQANIADVEEFIGDQQSRDLRSVQLQVAAWQPNTKET